MFKTKIISKNKTDNKSINYSYIETFYKIYFGLYCWSPLVKGLYALATYLTPINLNLYRD